MEVKPCDIKTIQALQSHPAQLAGSAFSGGVVES
jgi:hypothetical protein